MGAATSDRKKGRRPSRFPDQDAWLYCPRCLSDHLLTAREAVQLSYGKDLNQSHPSRGRRRPHGSPSHASATTSIRSDPTSTRSVARSDPVLAARVRAEKPDPSPCAQGTLTSTSGSPLHLIERLSSNLSQYASLGEELPMRIVTFVAVVTLTSGALGCSWTPTYRTAGGAAAGGAAG